MQTEIVVLLVVLAVVAGVVFRPGPGLVRWLRGGRRAAQRMRLEDGLKHLHHCEYEDRPGGIESLAGALEVPRRTAVSILSELEEAGLARSTGDRVELTEAGRTYALRVVRSHRLWERYLADRTGAHPTVWHAEAEKREHTLTSGEVDELSARLGHPVYDPHGDPIPRGDGTMPPAAGVPLGSLEPGEVGVIVHIEDEPAEVYARLIGERLGPGTRVQALDAPAGHVRFRAGGREHEVDAVLASHVAVERLAGAEAAVEGSVEALATLPPGESARVVRIAAVCQGPQRRRLLDLGVVPGTVITAKLESASGDPVAYEIRGALIALRREQAEWILVRRGGNGVG